MSELLRQLTTEHLESTQLLETIAEGIENQQLIGLQELLNRATELRGNDEVVINLQKQLTDQRKKIVQRDTIYFDAERLFEQGKAQGARIALKKAPKIELKANQQEFKDRIESIVATELRLAAAFKEAMADGVLEPAEVINLLQISYSYLKLNPNHETICLRNKQLIDRVLKTPSVYRDFFVTMPTEQFFQLPTEVLSKVPADVFSTLPAEVLSKLPLVVNSLGMALKRIPVGTFQMGEGDESHKVTLTRPYFLGVYEVTQEEYELVMGTNPSKFQGARNPVEQVSWDEAVSFCKKLSELDDEKKAGRVYHLPTEAEWEYACRAGTTTAYSFGDISEGGRWDGVDDDGNEIGGRFYEGDQDEHAWSKSNSGDRTHPVGEKRPNSWGLYDMHGNVFEWCQDWNGVISRGSATDPQGPSNGSNRIVRGGSWNNDHTFSGSAFRFNALPSRRSSCLGFRVAVHEDSTKDEDDDENQYNELLDFIKRSGFDFTPLAFDGA